MALLLAYSFTESGTTVTDRSGNGRDAAMLDTSTPIDLHSSGTCLISGAGHHVVYNAASDSAALPTAACSITAKVIMGNTPSIGQEGSIFSKFRSSASSSFNLYLDSGLLSAVVRGAAPAVIAHTPVLTTNTAHQVALTYDGTTTRMYLNGTQVQSSTAATGALDMSGTGDALTWQIGNHSLDPDMTYTDSYSVDDIRLFNHALSPAEVTSYAATPVSDSTTKYTELEWSLKLQAPAVDDEVYEFRVYAGATPLDTYAVTPQLTAEVVSGPVNYNETGRAITIAATVASPSDQADFKELALAVSVVATPAASAQYDNRELALAIPVVATPEVTPQYDHRELALAVTAVATPTETSQADFKELNRSVSAVVTLTEISQADFKDLARAVSITAATVVPDQADFKEVNLPVSAVATVGITTVVHRKELALAAPVIAAVTTPTDQADFKDLTLLTSAVATVTCTDVPGTPEAQVLQDSFRWRNDDGSQTTATWAAALNTNVTVAPGVSTRLRVLLDSTAPPPAATYKLYFKKSTDSVWEPVPVGAGHGEPMYVALSPNIASGGEPTTTQLTPPAGKTTTDFAIGAAWDDENGDLALYTNRPAQSFGFAYEDTGPDNLEYYAEPGGLVIAGRISYDNADFQAVAAGGGCVLLYFDPMIDNDFGTYADLLINSSVYGAAVPRWPGDIEANEWGYLNDFRVGGILQGKLEGVLEQMVDDNPHMGGFFIDDVGSRSYFPLINWSTFGSTNQADYRAGAIAICQTVRNVCDAHNLIFIVNGTWHAGTLAALGGGYPDMGQTGMSLADGGYVEHHPFDTFWNAYGAATQWASESAVTNGTSFMLSATDDDTNRDLFIASDSYAYVVTQPGDDYGSPPIPYQRVALHRITDRADLMVSSVRFDADGDGYTGPAATGLGGTFTVCGWVYLSVDRNTYSTFWSIDNGAQYTAMITEINGTTLYWATNGGGINSGHSDDCRAVVLRRHCVHEYDGGQAVLGGGD